MFYTLKEIPMQRIIFATIATLATLALVTSASWAGNPHLTPSGAEITTSCSDSTVSTSGKVSGLGNEPQICVELTATALCINNGGRHPKAVNKSGVSAGGDFPVQNGKAVFSVEGTATFQPDCSPPMTVEFQDINLLVTTGTFDGTNCIGGATLINRDLGNCTP
jgi:hypothetical protein